MKCFTLLLFFIPNLLFSQYWYEQKKEYFFLGAGVDVRNMLFGGTVNDQAYDGTFKIGLRSNHFSLTAFYENFSAIEYESFNISPGYVFRPGKMLIPVADLSLSFIKRPWSVYPSLAANSILEFHFHRFYIFARGEYRWRTDYDFFQASVYGGIAYKFSFKD